MNRETNKSAPEMFTGATVGQKSSPAPITISIDVYFFMHLRFTTFFSCFAQAVPSDCVIGCKIHQWQRLNGMQHKDIRGQFTN